MTPQTPEPAGPVRSVYYAALDRAALNVLTDLSADIAHTDPTADPPPEDIFQVLRDLPDIVCDYAKFLHPFGPFYPTCPYLLASDGRPTIHPQDWLAEDKDLTRCLAAVGATWLPLENAMRDAFAQQARKTAGHALAPWPFPGPQPAPWPDYFYEPPAGAECAPQPKPLELWYALRALFTHLAHSAEDIRRAARSVPDQDTNNTILRRYLAFHPQRPESYVRLPDWLRRQTPPPPDRYVLPVTLQQLDSILRPAKQADPEQLAAILGPANPTDRTQLQRLIADAPPELKGTATVRTAFTAPVARALDQALWTQASLDMPRLRHNLGSTIRRNMDGSPACKSKQWWDLLARILNHVPIVLGIRCPTAPLDAAAVRDHVTRP